MKNARAVIVVLYMGAQMFPRKILAILILAGAFACSTMAQPVVTTVVNKASYSAVVSPNCWVVIAGYNFAASSLPAPAGSSPTTLGGVSVTVAGLPAPLVYVSPNEIDALIPPQAAIPQNTVAPLVVTSGAGSVTYNIRLTRNSPALFTSPDTGQALVFDAGFRQVDTVGPQDTLILYAAGLGPTDGSGRVVDNVEVYIGERSAPVLFAGLAPGLPGIYQLNVTAPTPATDRIYLRSGGWQSNIVNIGIRSGTNTANVKGSIDGLYPSSDPGYPNTPLRPCVGDNDPGPCGPAGVFASLSIMLHAGTFTVSFDTVPGAGPFAVAAVGEAGGSIISIDPAAGTYTASVTTLTPASASGDFSSSTVPLWDYGSCNWKSGVCQPFPANIVPPSRIDPYWVRAIQTLPAPNMTAVASPNTLLQVSGSLSGSRFALDAQNNSSLATFGGIVQVPYGPFDLGVSTFSLYVDGKLIASKGLPYLLFQRAPASFGPGDF
ncbi:MAG TPA: hypothetical protein VE959_33330 [Bryobacteraceae bacterium]|nr:hypothetical protein [Bryobacteraceae bacterium]